MTIRGNAAMRKTKTEKQAKQRSNRLKKIAKRLAAYSAAAAATVVATQDRSVEAADILWDIPDVSVGTGQLVRWR